MEEHTVIKKGPGSPELSNVRWLKKKKRTRKEKHTAGPANYGHRHARKRFHFKIRRIPQF
jgi:hypothetical protein